MRISDWSSDVCSSDLLIPAAERILPMNVQSKSKASDKAAVLEKIDALLPELERIYVDLHQNPELSMQAVRTAGIAADWLEKYGFEVHRNIGKTGVVGLLKNGEGPCILLRADMDGLPVRSEEHTSERQALMRTS